MSLTTEELEAFVQRLAADTERWRPLVNHDPSKRTYELLWEDDQVSAWVLCWSEDRLRLDRGARDVVYGAGQTFTVPPDAIHRVLHAGQGPAVTIHAYSPPLKRMGAYSETPSGELVRVAQTHEDELRAELALA